MIVSSVRFDARAYDRYRVRHRCLRILIVIALLASPSGAQNVVGSPAFAPAREGAVRAIKVTVPRIGRGLQAAEAWSITVQQPGARWIRLKMTNIIDASVVDYQVAILGGDLTRIATYGKKEFGSRKSLWSGYIKGGYARVVVVPTQDARPVGLKFSLDKVIFDSPGAVLESVVDRNNPKLQPVRMFASDSVLQRVSSSVVKLRGVGRNSNETCTGFMVTSNLMVTNEHCIPNASVCESMVALFDWDPAIDDESDGKRFTCIKLECADAQYDFAIVRLSGHPGDINQWGHLTLKSKTLIEGDSLYVVQYPGVSEVKQLARDGCSVKTPQAPGVSAGVLSDFGHLCDTKGGSSGSPVLAPDNTVVGLHHLPFSEDEHRWCCENRAVQIAVVSASLAKLGNGN
jgi:V8-like Glu-specific endopeptidase